MWEGSAHGDVTSEERDSLLVANLSLAHMMEDESLATPRPTNSGKLSTTIARASSKLARAVGRGLGAVSDFLRSASDSEAIDPFASMDAIPRNGDATREGTRRERERESERDLSFDSLLTDEEINDPTLDLARLTDAELDDHAERLVATITPAIAHTSGAAHHDLVDDALRVYHDEEAPDGLRRGLALHAEAASEQREVSFPVIRAVCTGRLQKTMGRRSSSETMYTLRIGNTGMILNAHPLYNAWALANEPAVGETANCIMQTMDVFVPAPRTDTKASGEESRPTRTAKEVAKTRMSECVEELGVAIVVLVQVRPSADGILTVHYGDTFVRDYECGNAPSPCYVTQRELLEFIGDRCNDDYEVARRLLLYGAPLNKGTADLAKEWQDQGPLQPTMRTANGEIGRASCRERV